jgi:membrane fusion protein, copper/silver efflux system
VTEETPTPPPAKPKSRLVYALDIVLVRLRFILLLVIVMLLAAYWDDIVARIERLFPHKGDETAAASDTEWFCPMHPNIVRAEPGNCPICGMPLSKRKKGAKEELPDGVLTRVQFTPFRIAQGGIRTSPVEWKPLEREIETVGVVDYDERKLARITARFPGRVESLAVDFTGTAVTRGKPLVTLYSPEVYAAQESLVSAARTLREAESASPQDAHVVERNRTLVDAARSRMALWGLLPEQVAAIEKSGKASPTVEVLAPISGIVTKKSVVAGDYVAEGAALFDVADLSTVWIKARVYEADLGIVATGQKVAASSSAFPGETFEGTIVFVDPFLDRATRTADLRVDLPNPDARLKPGMYVTATVRVQLVDVEPFKSMPRPAASTATRTVYWCPMHPEVTCDEPGKCEKCGSMELVKKVIPTGPTGHDVLAVPETAVVDTGTRKIVYVESSPGVFDAHEVVLGPRAGDSYPVVKGLEPGMRVATAGSFLIDAETRLNPAAAGAYFGASATRPKSTSSENGK